MSLPRIVILGGGMGGLAAAHALTSQTGWRSRYEVVVYQMGWRLGGKCASSRNATRHQRIEEHGLHVWFGFYENAVALLKSCYREIGLPSPFDAQHGTFRGRQDVRMLEELGTDWEPWDIPFPIGAGEPGEPGNPQPDIRQVCVQLVEFVEEYVREKTTGVLPFSSALGLQDFDDLGAIALEKIRQIVGIDPKDLATFVSGNLGPALVDFRDVVRLLLDAAAVLHPQLRRIRIVADLCLTVAIGILRDNLLVRGFEAADHEELLAWLTRHGADNETARLDTCVPLRALYDTCFAFARGEVTKPCFAAGTALGVALRIGLTYRGHVLYTMLAGMGDVVIAPIYRVLKQRGVRFEFFQRVTRLEPTADGTNIASVHFARQATVKAPPYEPLEPNVAHPHFPHTPRYADLVEGVTLENDRIDLESHWYRLHWQDAENWKLDLRPKDKVVLATSLGPLPELCQDLTSNSAWKNMLDGLPTIETQSMQVWLSKSSADLGWDGNPRTLPTMVAAPEPHDVWADLSPVIDFEGWPHGNRPASVQFFCGPMTGDYAGTASNDPTAPERAAQEVEETGRRWLQKYMRHLLPNTAELGTRDIDWDILFGDPTTKGPSRLRLQWLRANIDPSERYVLSPPGANALRLDPGDSGFANLMLAGDWTRTPINAGCVEAAVMSGYAASRALCGHPAVIHGEHFLKAV